MPKNSQAAMQDIALDMSDYFSGKSVHLFEIDYSGHRESEKLIEALERYGDQNLRYSSSMVEMAAGKDERFGEFRPLRVGNMITYEGVLEPDAIVAIENNVRTGLSAVSGVIGILYAMELEMIPGKGKTDVYLLTTEGDEIGLSNFSVVPSSQPYTGVRKHMERIAPKTYTDLSELGLIHQISNREPPITSSAPDMHDAVERLVRLSGALLI